MARLRSSSSSSPDPLLVSDMAASDSPREQSERPCLSGDVQVPPWWPIVATSEREKGWTGLEGFELQLQKGKTEKGAGCTAEVAGAVSTCEQYWLMVVRRRVKGYGVAGLFGGRKAQVAASL